ncbi:hypothetical protein ACTID9_17780 [Brevibacillus fluminis]|uniref:hypothetical protein n=1 Tax=Brevibacillus fluminis TaxID=511487 RepID=UPI003F8B4748
MRKQAKHAENLQAAAFTATKPEWIERAAALAAERFEVAGALYDEPATAQLSETAVMDKLKTYKEGANK